jgi:hypothetical protein
MTAIGPPEAYRIEVKVWRLPGWLRGMLRLDAKGGFRLPWGKYILEKGAAD